MFRSLSRIPVKWNSYTVNVSSNTHQYHLQISSLKSLSTLPKSTNETLNYLINTCRLSRDSALKIASRIDINSTIKPDSVLQLFRNFGFSEYHIAEIITKLPSLLMAKSCKTLKPKLEFFTNSGISNSELGKIIAFDPTILTRSLDNQIIPCISLLKTFCKTNSNMVALISRKRGSWIIHKFSDAASLNIETLRKEGVPDSSISKLFMFRPKTLSRNVDEFKEAVTELKEMGFDPTSTMFIRGVAALLGMKKEKWVSKVAVFRSFGWSDKQFREILVKQPQVMESSEKRIERALDFFMNKMGWTMDQIMKYPVVLYISKEKRVLPRLFVVEQLIGKGLVEGVNRGVVLLMTEDKFLSKFVMKFQEDIPGLLEMYNKKVGIL